MKAKQRFPWVPVSAAAALLVVGVTAWLQLPVAPPAEQMNAPLPLLGFTQLGSKATTDVIAEQLAAYDPTPLFLPSPMNNRAKVFLDEEQGGVRGPFADLGPNLVFNDQKATLAFPAIVEVPVGPVQGLNLTDKIDVPIVMGRFDGVEGKLAGRTGYLEAVKAGDGRVVLSLTLPETPGGPQSDWQPMELVGAVSRFGLIGDLVVVVSSGSDSVDDYFSAQLARTVRVGERLAPGFYTFRIGP